MKLNRISSHVSSIYYLHKSSSYDSESNDPIILLNSKNHLIVQRTKPASMEFSIIGILS